MPSVTLRLGEDLEMRVREAAKAEGISVSRWIRRAVQEFLDGPQSAVLAVRIEELERQVGRLSEMAGFA